MNSNLVFHKVLFHNRHLNIEKHMYSTLGRNSERNLTNPYKTHKTFTRKGRQMPGLENWGWWVKDILWHANSPPTHSVYVHVVWGKLCSGFLPLLPFASVLYTCLSMYEYSGTSLIRTPLGHPELHIALIM